MAEAPQHRRSALNLTLMFAYLGVLGMLLVVSPRSLQNAAVAEQRVVSAWMGPEADMWITTRIAGALVEATKTANDLAVAGQLTGYQKVDVWVTSRIFVALLWIHVVLYRVFLNALWFFIACPIVFAAAMDGYYRREISKNTFTSQSPMLHKRGMQATKYMLLALLGMTVLPARMPVIFAPACVLLSAWSVRAWIANAPKRL